MIRFLLLLILLYGPSLLKGQPALEHIQPPVMGQTRELKMAFAGGLNSAQYQTMDLDADQLADLVIFDRSADKINCFINTGSEYVYQPYFEYFFPADIQNWMVLADYDCDGQKDLFTYTGQGIRVFRNTSGATGNPAWQLEVEPLRTLGSSSMINLLFNPTDIPSIADIDGDGDLDILVFDFSSSSQIEFHKNYSVENNGTCGLEFVRETRTYGDIRDCDCDDFTVNEPCSSAERTLHAGGKAILSLDYNSDGIQDLVLSQEGCDNLSFTSNKGTTEIPEFDLFNNNFPTLNNPLAFTSFPAAFYEDVTLDGKKDLLISCNERSNSAQNINFKSSSFVYENIGSGSSNTFSTSSVFLQSQMIDVGEHAYPAIEDVNGDGLDDLVIGNAGSIINDQYLSSLTVFQSTASGLSWQSDDWMGFSSLNYKYIKPQFIDLDDDGMPDLVFSAQDESNQTRLYYVLNQGNTELSFDIADIEMIDVTLTFLDDFHLTDVNQDGKPDLLLGLSGGRLDYYINIGSTGNPVFALETQEFLGITFNGDRSSLSLSSGDLDGDGLQDLITTDRTGVIRYYPDLLSGSTVSQPVQIRSSDGLNLGTSQLGRVTRPYFGRMAGRNVVAIGSIQGGIRMFATADDFNENNLTLNAFPVPVSADGLVTFNTNQSETKLEIFTLAGQLVHQSTLTAFESTPISLRHLKDGLYLAKATRGSNSCTLKIVLSGAE